MTFSVAAAATEKPPKVTNPLLTLAGWLLTGPAGSSVGVALVVVELVNLESDHAVAGRERALP